MPCPRSVYAFGKQFPTGHPQPLHVFVLRQNSMCSSLNVRMATCVTFHYTEASTNSDLKFRQRCCRISLNTDMARHFLPSLKYKPDHSGSQPDNVSYIQILRSWTLSVVLSLCETECFLNYSLPVFRLNSLSWVHSTELVPISGPEQNRFK